MFISILYMFRAVMLLWSGELYQLYQYDIWYMSLVVCKFDCTPDGHPHEWHIPDVVLIQLIQFSWWLAHGCPKHVENKNKHTWKTIVCQVGYLQRLYRDARSTQHKILHIKIFHHFRSCSHESTANTVLFKTISKLTSLRITGRNGHKRATE